MQLGVGDGGAVDLGFEQRQLHGFIPAPEAIRAGHV
jgi:hypothetical protein